MKVQYQQGAMMMKGKDGCSMKTQTEEVTAGPLVQSQNF